VSAEAVLRLVADTRHAVVPLQRAALADSTTEHYERVWNHYRAWCADREIDALAADGAPLAVWLSEYWDKRPTTLRTYANAVSWGCHRSGVGDAGSDAVVSRLLNAHARFHGVAPVAANTVKSFDRAELLAVVSAPFVARGNITETGLLRNRCALILAHRRVPQNQLVRIRSDGVRLEGEAVHLELPEVTYLSLPHSQRVAATTLTLAVRDDELDPRQLISLAQTGPQRELLFGVMSHVKGGRYGTDVAESATHSTKAISDALVSALRSATRRAHLDPTKSLFEYVGTLGVDDVLKLWWHANPGHLTELRTRAYAAALVSTGARHDDFAHVRVETMERVPAGLRVLVERSKADQSGVGEWKFIPHTPGHPPTCPACLVIQWITDARLTNGALFASLEIGGRVKDTAVAVEEMAAEIQRLAQRVGVDKRVGTHSLRKTHATLRAENGDEAWAIAKTTGQSADVVLRHYVTPARILDHTAQL